MWPQATGTGTAGARGAKGSVIIKFKKIAIAVAVATSLTTIPLAAGQESIQPNKNLVTVTVVGVGMDKDEARRDALRKAVEQAAGTFIYSQSQTRDFVLVKDTVLTRSAGFIERTEPVSERQVEDGTWEVKIKAVVSVKGIEDYWGTVTTMLSELGRPKIMVIIREKIGPELVQESTVQSRIENILLKSGFLLVNKEQLKAIDKKDMGAALADNNPAKVQAVAKRFGAQIFISGSADAAMGPRKEVRGIPVFACEAQANIKCYRSDTAQLLSSIPGEPTRGTARVWRSAAQKALDLQAEQLSPKVRDDILRFWQDALSGLGEVQLHVEGISFKQYVELKKAIKDLKQVSDVVAKYHNEIAECSLQSGVSAETLAEKLLEAFEHLEIQDVTQNVIKARMKP
ncbi:MAG: hypothetical protein HQ546_05810 [Planctomycetes bacterium]|nr:hypothetical protein [Planctomycetota bacterium]